APGAPVDDRIAAVAMSDDGSILVAAGYALWVWDTSNGRQMAANWGAAPETGRSSFTSYRCAAFPPSGQTFAVGGTDGTVTFWDPWAHTEIGRPFHASPHGAIAALAYSPDGTLLATASEDWTIRVWDTQTRAEV